MNEYLVDIGVLKLNVAEGRRTGRPLLLLHGGSGNWRGWAPVAAALSGEWHVIAPDLRGHGRSGRAKRYRIVDYAEDVEALIEQHLDDVPVIAGHSLGGHVAVAVAARRPEYARAVAVGDAPFDRARLRRHIVGNRARNEAWRDLAASGAAAPVIAGRGDRRAQLHDAGHKLFLRAPDAFTAVLRQFLDEVASRDPMNH